MMRARASSPSTWRSAAARARRPRRTSRSTSSSPIPTRSSTTSTPEQVDERASRTAPARPRARRSQRDRRPAAVGPEHDDAAGRGGRARGSVRGARADPARAPDRPAARPHPRRAGAVGGVGGPGLGRRAADRRAQARPREGRARAHGPRRGDVGGVGTRAAVLARGAREGELQAVRAGARASARAPAAVHRVLRRHGRVRAPVRHPARRLRARPHDRGAAAGCSRTSREELVPLVSAAAAAGEDGRVFPGHFPTERQQPFAEELLQRRRLQRRALAPGPVGAPVRALDGAHGRAAHDALGARRPRGGVLLLPARVRARPVRGADVARALPDDARRRRRPRHPRVPEPAVGEPRRPRQALLRVDPAGHAAPLRAPVRRLGRQ